MCSPLPAYAGTLQACVSVDTVPLAMIARAARYTKHHHSSRMSTDRTTISRETPLGDDPNGCSWHEVSVGLVAPVRQVVVLDLLPLVVSFHVHTSAPSISAVTYDDFSCRISPEWSPGAQALAIGGPQRCM
jgi:hypothetical protein